MSESKSITEALPLTASPSRGFTLIELMIALAVVGILAVIAYPSYAEHIRRSRMTDAQTTLASLRVKQEQFYADNRNYGSSTTGCTGLVMPTGSPFTFTCTSRTTTNANQTFLLSATGSGAMTGYTFTLNELNERRTTAFVGVSSGLPFTCWKTRSSDSC